MARTNGSKKSIGKNRFGFFINLIWVLSVSALLFILVFFVLVKFSRLPDISELENPKYELSTVIYDINNKELGKHFTYNRVWTSYEELNPDIVEALLATEDIRFFSHSGIDSRSTLRAIVFLGKKGGASTITQQLAKLFFTRRHTNKFIRIWQKVQEWLIAIELEKRYTKEEIMAMYLNKFDFLYNSHGIESASRTYFGKSHKELSTDEAALLVGMLKWPVRYNPIRNPERSKARRNVVLRQMRKYGYLEKKEYEEFIKKDLDISGFSSTTVFKGPAPYFRSEVIKWVTELLKDPKYSKKDGTYYNINLDGLKIYTTLDKDYQILAEKAVYERMKELQGVFNTVWKGMDIWTHGANAHQQKIRNETLNRFIKQSNRFNNIRNQVMTPLIDSITDIITDARLWDVDIQRMLEQEKNPKYLSELRKKDHISSKQEKTYTKVIESDFWPKLKRQQAKFNNEVKRSFNTKTKMRVFDYNVAGEKEVVMTPIDSIKYHISILQAGMLAIDPRDGYIKAWVGGVDFKYFMYDHINTKRQVGSTFKPFIYATAIYSMGINPCMKVHDIQYSIVPGEGDFGLIDTWTPGNVDKFTGEYYNLFDALFKSLNSVSVYLMKELGNVDVVRNLVENFGINKNDIPRQPSICLGAADLSVMQMTGAFSVFSNNGYYNQPVFVTRIEDRNGRIIYRHVPETKQALSPDFNYTMVELLRYAGRTVQSRLSTPVGGKTGTTNDYRDGWFMGISPELVVGTWVGGSEQWIRFRSINYGQGSYMARPVFEKFMQALEKQPDIDYNKNVNFFKPPDGAGIELDCRLFDQGREVLNVPSVEEFEEF
jgi:penicillin-binding protein 1A